MWWRQGVFVFCHKISEVFSVFILQSTGIPKEVSQATPGDFRFFVMKFLMFADSLVVSLLPFPGGPPTLLSCRVDRRPSCRVASSLPGWTADLLVVSLLPFLGGPLTLL